MEWATAKENIRHTYDVLGRKGVSTNKGKTGKLSCSSKKVIQYDLDGNLIKEWDCMNDVTRELGIDQGSISKCCNFKRKSVGGYIWRLKESECGE